MDTLTPVRHLDCGEIAFRVRCTVDVARDEGAILNSALVAYDDNRVTRDDDGFSEYGTVLTCQHCNHGIASVDVQGDQLVALSDDS